MSELTVTITEVVEWIERVARKDIAFDWQKNRAAYYQYMVEVQFGLGGFTAETWFLDESRRSFGWPQLIIADYCQYQAEQARLKEAAATPDPVLATLAAMQTQIAELQAKLAATNGAATPEPSPAAAPDAPAAAPGAEAAPAGEG